MILHVEAARSRRYTPMRTRIYCVKAMGKPVAVGNMVITKDSVVCFKP